EGVDLHPVGPGAAAEEPVVLVLDARLADLVALREPGVPGLLELLRCDLADVAEDVGRDVSVLVLPGEDALDAHPREARLVLAQVVDLVDAEPLLPDHRAARRRARAFPEGLADLNHRHAADGGELVELA